MKIRSVKIRNLRNLINCTAENLPNLVVVAGPNGAGKSTFLEAITIWKQFLHGYSTRQWLSPTDLTNLVTKGADFATIEIKTEIEKQDLDYLQRIGIPGIPDAPVIDDSSVIIRANGSVEARSQNHNLLQHLFRYPIRSNFPEAPIFDYYGPNRYLPPKDFTTFDVNNMSMQAEEQRRIQPSKQLEMKSDTLKDFLYSLYQKDADWFIAKRNELKGQGTIALAEAPDSFADVRKIVSFLLPQLSFEAVSSGSPIEFLFQVSGGKLVELDYLSSGEKAVLALFLEIYRIKAMNSIIILDEPELHLNQSVESRIIPHIMNNIVSDNNQVFVVSHSTGILSTAPSENIFRITSSKSEEENQFVSISSEQDRIDTLRSVVGNLGIFTTSNVFVFLEGTSSNKSIDKLILDTLFPQLRGKVTFIPGDSCEVVEIISKKVSQIISSGIPFGRFYAIRDRDRLSNDEVSRKETEISSLRVWSRCMIENFLLEPVAWSKAMEVIGVTLDVGVIREAFITAANNIKAEEIDLRLDEKLRASIVMKDFRNSKGYTTENKLDRLKTMIEKAKTDLPSTLAEIERQIDSQLSDGTFIRFFHGKNLIKEAKKILNIEISNEYFIPLVANKIRELNIIPQDMNEILHDLLSREQI
ncbi:hypothetical protein GCM10023310_53330 [Paenibacillus vulneris]|uniref:AAA family ATPase n=1 Tax=Paenibacillus vulneris TaxID=1133364 RepID=A0ABW3UM77_9BACL